MRYVLSARKQSWLYVPASLDPTGRTRWHSQAVVHLLLISKKPFEVDAHDNLSKHFEIPGMPPNRLDSNVMETAAASDPVKSKVFYIISTVSNRIRCRPTGISHT